MDIKGAIVRVYPLNETERIYGLNKPAGTVRHCKKIWTIKK